MNTSTISNHYIIYTRHREAVKTIARFLNVPVSEVISRLDKKIAPDYDGDDPLYSRHARAIDTVARFAGIGIDQILRGLHGRLQRPDSGAGITGSEMTAAVATA